jgi:hypothetical protein
MRNGGAAIVRASVDGNAELRRLLRLCLQRGQNMVCSISQRVVPRKILGNGLVCTLRTLTRAAGVEATGAITNVLCILSMRSWNRSAEGFGDRTCVTVDFVVLDGDSVTV